VGGAVTRLPRGHVRGFWADRPLVTVPKGTPHETPAMDTSTSRDPIPDPSTADPINQAPSPPAFLAEPYPVPGTDGSTGDSGTGTRPGAGTFPGGDGSSAFQGGDGRGHGPRGRASGPDQATTGGS
jgi:hypothetical protein